MIRRKLRTLALAAAAAVAIPSCGIGSSGASPEDYPNGNVRILVSYSAGGPTDLAARAIAPCLEEELGGTFVVENKPGGSGSVAMNEAAAAQGDGKTLAISAVGNTVLAPILAENVGYTLEDFTYLGGIYELPSVLTVPKGSSYGSADELIAAAKKSPGEIQVATPGSQTYDAELLRMEELYDVKFSNVPFEGTSDAVAASLGGNVDAMFSDAGDAVVAQLEAQELKALATGAPEPVTFLDGVPTLASLGYDELTLTMNPFALAAPKATPEPIVQKLASAIKSCSMLDTVAERYGERYQPERFMAGDEIAERFAEIDQSFKPYLTE